MANHSILKLVLFLCAGVVVMNLHALTLDEIRGWGRNKTALKIAFALGGLGISGVPLLNGYLSKSMLHEGILHLIEQAEEGGGTLSPFLQGLSPFFHAAEGVFLISGGCTFAYMLKLYLCVFWEKNADKKRQKQYDKNPHCMNRLSEGVILFSALLLIPMGQPGIMRPLARWMTGTAPRFDAFSWENLRGALLSLSIGAVIYLLFVLPVLRPHGAYVNRWPEGLDLERRVYRPLLLDGLAGVFGTLARIPAENALLRPLFIGLVFLWTVIARILSDSTDALVILLRGTVVREVKVQDGHERVSFLRGFRRATEETLGPLAENFSFAMLMTCVGIFLILALLLLLQR